MHDVALTSGAPPGNEDINILGSMSRAFASSGQRSASLPRASGAACRRLHRSSRFSRIFNMPLCGREQPQPSAPPSRRGAVEVLQQEGAGGHRGERQAPAAGGGQRHGADPAPVPHRRRRPLRDVGRGSELGGGSVGEAGGSTGHPIDGLIARVTRCAVQSLALLPPGRHMHTADEEWT